MEDVRWLMAGEIPRLRRYALILTRNDHEADDLVQDCLERAIRKQHQWRKHGSIRSWLYRILFSVFINQRKRQRKHEGAVSLDVVPVQACVEPSQEDRIACLEIGEALARLPDEQRAAIALTVIEGFSYDEAAEMMNIPIGTLRSRLFRGRETLRQLYDEGAPKTDVGRSFELRRVK